MKIAVCYSGLVRTLPKLIDNHRKHLLDRYDCRVFGNFWDIYGVTPRGWGDVVVYNSGDVVTPADRAKIVNQLSMVEFKFESFRKFEEERQELFSFFSQQTSCNTKNIIAMCYQLHQSYRDLIHHTVSTNTKFDAVLRMRGDLKFLQNVTIPLIEGDILYVPQRSYSHMLNDQFGIGSIDTMRVYAEMYNKIQKVFVESNADCSLHPETLLQTVVDENNVVVKKEVGAEYTIDREGI